MTNKVVDFEPQTDFVERIDKIVSDTGLGYIDAVLHYCEQVQLEPEYAGSLVSKSPQLTAKIQEEAEALHFLEKTARLPV